MAGKIIHKNILLYSCYINALLRHHQRFFLQKKKKEGETMLRHTARPHMEKESKLEVFIKSFPSEVRKFQGTSRELPGRRGL